MKTNLLYIPLLSILLSGCFSAPDNALENDEHKISQHEIEEYWIKFYKIDNQVKVFVNNAQIFDSGKNEEKAQEEIAVGLSHHLNRGTNEVRVELYNDPPYEGFIGFDKHWEVFYELFNQDVPIDYIHEQADDGATGRVWHIEHEIHMD